MLRAGRLVVACSILIGAGAVPASAGDDQAVTDLRRLSLAQLGEIVVTSVAKAPEEVWRTPAAIHVLTRQDILRSGATSVPDVLRFVPGVQVARIDSSRNWVVGVRGFGDQYSKSLLVLIDGRSVYTPLFGGVHWSIQDVLLEDIERIEIIRGPGGTVWGANAVNGVINIITRSAGQTQGTFASVAVGNVDQVIGGARYGGSLGDTWHYRVYGKAFKRGPQWHTDDREFDRWHLAQGGFRIDGKRGDRDTFSIHGDAYSGDIGESVLVASFTPPGQSLVDAPVDVAGQNIVGRWERSLSGDANISLQGYWDRTRRFGTDFGETRNTFELDFTHRFSPAPRHALVWGAGARLGPSTYVQTIEAADFQPHDQRYDLFSVFAQDAIRLPARLTFTAGAKFEHNTYTGLEVQPHASLLWAPNARHSAWIAATRAVRTPSRIDTDINVEQFVARGTTLPLYARVLGTRNVRAETLGSLEAGYRTLVTSAVYVDAVTFHHRYDDIVALGPAVVDFPARHGMTYQRVSFPFTNGVEGSTRGFEIAPSVTALPGVTVRGSYSLLWSDLRRKPGIPGTPFTSLILDGSPRHQVVLQGLASKGRLDISPTYRYVSERRATEIPGYHELDVPVSWALTPSLTLGLVGQNLLHAHHPEWARDPGPTVEIRRSAYVRLTWRR